MRTKKAYSFNKKLFGKRLKAFRDKLGMIQKDFAKEIDRTRSAYVVIESGRVSPSVEVLVDIHKFLNKKGIKVSMDYIFGLSESQSETEVIKDLTNKLNECKKNYEKEMQINSLQAQLLDKKK